MEKARDLLDKSCGNARRGTERRRRGDWRPYRVLERAQTKVQVRVAR